MSTATIDPPRSASTGSPAIQGLKVPSLQDLLQKPAAPSAPPSSEPTKISTDLREGLSRGSTSIAKPPTPPPAPSIPAPIVQKPEGTQPEAEGEDDNEDGIDTHIAPPSKKSKEQIIRERQQSKEQRARQKLGVDEIERSLNETREQNARIQAELEELKTARQKEQKELEDFRALSTAKEQELKKVQESYYDQFKPQYDAASDEKLKAANSSFFTNLGKEAPEFITNAEGKNVRVMFDQLIANPKTARHFEELAAIYGDSLAAGNQKNMDYAVNSGLQLLGANVKFLGIDNPDNVLLDADSPEFVRMEKALKSALPHLQEKFKRINEIKESEPELVEQKIGERANSIRGRLNGAFTMPPEELTRRLAQDPTDSVALFTSVMNAAPALKQEVEANIASMAPVLASLSDQLHLPPLKSKDPAAIAQHQKMQADYRKKIGEFTTYAVIGRAVGSVLSSVIAERDAALSRAGKAALVTNPGDHNATEDGFQEQTEIDTKIVPDRRY